MSPAPVRAKQSLIQIGPEARLKVRGIFTDARNSGITVIIRPLDIHMAMTVLSIGKYVISARENTERQPIYLSQTERMRFVLVDVPDNTFLH